MKNPKNKKNDATKQEKSELDELIDLTDNYYKKNVPMTLDELVAVHKKITMLKWGSDWRSHWGSK
jgi:hypothetical protein